MTIKHILVVGILFMQSGESIFAAAAPEMNLAEELAKYQQEKREQRKKMFTPEQLFASDLSDWEAQVQGQTLGRVLEFLKDNIILTKANHITKEDVKKLIFVFDIKLNNAIHGDGVLRHYMIRQLYTAQAVLEFVKKTANTELAATMQRRFDRAVQEHAKALSKN